MTTIAEFTTAKAAKAWLTETARVSERVANLLIKESAPLRHAQRVRTVHQTLNTFFDIADPTCHLFDADKALLLLVDKMGVGGRGGCEGKSTRRHPVLSSLGKGRKKATDGGAWDSALETAWDEILGCRDVVVRPYFGDVGPGGIEAILVHPTAPSEEEDDSTYDVCTHAPEWAYTLAREGLRVAAGLDRYFEPWCRFEGDVEAWGKIVDHLEKVLTQPPREEANETPTPPGTPVIDHKPDISARAKDPMYPLNNLRSSDPTDPSGQGPFTAGYEYGD